MQCQEICRNLQVVSSMQAAYNSSYGYKLFELG